MKEIRAYIQPFMLSKVTKALQKIAKFPGMSVEEVQGFGRGKVLAPGDRIIREFVPKIRLEVWSRTSWWRKWCAPSKRPPIPGIWEMG